MNIKVEQVDIDATKAHWPKETPFRPALIKNRKHDKEKWIVLSSPFIGGVFGPPKWSFTEHDEYIRIPLFPYKLSGKGHLALAYMLQLGLSCAGHLPERVTDFYVVVGHPVELLTDPVTEEPYLRYWVGFAILTEGDS